MSGISKFITSIEPDDDNDAPVDPNSKSKLGLQPIADDGIQHYQPESSYNPALQSYESIDTPSPAWIKKFAMGMVALWLISVVFIVYSLFGTGGSGQLISPLQWAGVSVLTIVPLIVIGVAYYTMRQLTRVSHQAVQLQRMADQLSQPDQLIVEQSETLAAKIAEHVDLVNSKLNEGMGRFSALEAVLQKQSASVAKLNEDARSSAQAIDTHVQAHKTSFDTILSGYDERMQSLSEILNTHAENLAQATRVAEQKIKEARISVEGATSKISDVSDMVRSNTLEAAETLSGSHDEIKSLGDMIKRRSEELDQVYKKHATDLSSMIEHLREEQKNLGANMEETLVRMRDLSLSAQASAESLSDASSAGKETIQALAQSANLADDAVKTRFAEMEQMVRYSTEHTQNINTVASQRVQDSLEQTRAEIARIETDMAGLQQKLQNSVSNSGRSDHKSGLDDRPSQRDRKPRVHVKTVEFTEPKTNVEETALETSEPVDEDLEFPQPEVPTTAEAALDLHIEATNVEDIEKGLGTSDPILAAIRPVAEYEANKKAKAGFSLRGLFGGKTDEDIATSDPNSNTQSILNSNEDNDESKSRSFIDTLTRMGLSPNVLVDDGCVIEAANSRSANGHEAMSRAVIARLNVPVKHFAATLSADPELSKRTIDFATNFDQKVEELSSNREAIRTSLESESGRAYLISDAALNYGRV